MGKFLFVLNCLAALAMIATSGEPIPSTFPHSGLGELLRMVAYENSIVFALSAGVITSTFFWFLVVRIPEAQRKRRLKAHLLKAYDSFKVSCTAVLVSASWAHRSHDVATSDLSIPAGFREYFSDDLWCAVANELDSHSFYRDELAAHIRELINEYNFVSYAVGSHSETALEHHRRSILILNEMLQYCRGQDDGTKLLLRRLWEILALWSFATGEMKNDPIEDIIRNL